MKKMTFIQKFIQKKNKVIAGNSVNSAGKLGNSVYPELRPEGWSNYLYKSRGYNAYQNCRITQAKWLTGRQKNCRVTQVIG